MKIEKKLFVLTNGRTAVGSVVVEKMGERAKCMVTLSSPISGRLVFMGEGEYIFPISGETKKTVDIDCSDTGRLKIYLYDGKQTFSTGRVSAAELAEVISRVERLENEAEIASGNKDEKTCVFLREEECSEDETQAEQESEKGEREECAGCGDVGYCDEAVAEENYYPSNLEFADDLLMMVRKKADEFPETSDTYHEKQDLFVHSIKEKGETEAKNSSEKVGCGIRTACDKNDGAGRRVEPFEQAGYTVKGRRADFYESVRFRIDELFVRFERQEDMERLMPDTKWVRINYGAGKFYVVGVVGSRPDYICYGVPGVYSPIPPACFEEGASFLPLDVRRPQGDGYWIIFQDARTGKVCFDV